MVSLVVTMRPYLADPAGTMKMQFLRKTFWKDLTADYADNADGKKPYLLHTRSGFLRPSRFLRQFISVNQRPSAVDKGFMDES